MEYAFRVLNDEDYYFTTIGEHAILAEKAGCEVVVYLSGSYLGEPVFQEKRYQFIEGQDIEYWADISKASYEHVHPTQRRIIYVTKGE